MEQLEKKFHTTQKALASLKKSIEQFNEYKKSGDTQYIDNLRDSIIKRFEFSLELTWKYIKTYLETKVGIKFEYQGPKPTFRYALKSEIITEDEAAQAIEMLNCRNLTSHMYQEEVANQITKQIPEFYQLMQNITEKTKP